MNDYSWNLTNPTRNVGESIKLELDNSNWWIVIEPKDIRFIVEPKMDL